jgi:hypothetical protein
MEVGMSSYVMDCEDKFIDEVSARIGGCESVGELLESLEKDGCMKLCIHMTDTQKLEFVDELWNDFWSEKGHG